MTFDVQRSAEKGVEMRTTLTIDDDVLAEAKRVAALQNKTVGEVISALARQALCRVATSPKTRNGVPLLSVRAGATPVMLDMVNELRDELL
jgi:Bacterial antitoxin of type II TA system, VapB